MPQGIKFEIDQSDLADMYVSQCMSQAAIARKLGIHQVTVGELLRRHEIPARASGTQPRSVLPLAELRSLYLDRQLSLRQIGKYFNCAHTIVTANLRRYGLIRSAVATRAIVSRSARQRNTAPFLSGERDYAVVEHSGYRLIRQPGGEYIGEHREVAARAIGRALAPGEDAHHINFRRRDNRPENLAVLTRSNHMRVHKYMGRVAAFLCGLTDIRPEPVDFGMPVFWGGEYVTSIDLIERARLRSPEARLSYDAPELAAVTVN